MEDHWMNQVKSASSPEEIRRMAKEHDYPLSPEEAENLFRQLHSSGEISDGELDSVSGGGCKTKVNGVKYTVVTQWLGCFNGYHELGFALRKDNAGKPTYSKCLNSDEVPLRTFWAMAIPTGKKCCGNCKHLSFKGGTGYCSKSG